MKSWTKLVAMGAFTCSLGFVTIATLQTASAATWHKGTPTALRGKFESTMPKKKAGAAGFAPQLMIYKTNVQSNESNNPLIYTHKLSWRHSGKIYYIKGTTKHNGFVLGGKTTYKIYRYNKNTLYMDPTAHHLKRGYAFKRVHSFKSFIR